MEKVLEILVEKIKTLEEEIRYLEQELNESRANNVNLNCVNDSLRERIKELENKND